MTELLLQLELVLKFAILIRFHFMANHVSIVFSDSVPFGFLQKCTYFQKGMVASLKGKFLFSLASMLNNCFLSVVMHWDLEPFFFFSFPL